MNSIGMLLERIVNTVFPDGIVFIFAFFLAILFVLGLAGKIPRQSTPSLLTSTGILGTFAGVFYALSSLEFTPEKMQESVTALLAGMSTAFATSLLGLFSAVVFKVIISFSWRVSAPKASPEHKDMIERLDAIKQAIAGEGDSSLVTQMQKLRDENRDGFKQLGGLSETIRETLGNNLRDLVEEIREIIGKQLGESLKGLIESIEKALIEQFGKTFVQFNEAVQTLKKWQEDHRRQVEHLTEAFEETAKGIETIRLECAQIPETMDKLRLILEQEQHQIENLEARLQAFAQMRQQAEDAFPAIQDSLNRVMEDLQNSAKGFHGMEEVIKNTFQQAEANVKEIAEGHAENVKRMAESMRETMEKAQRDAAAEVHQKISAEIERFQKEIDRVAEAWGGNLTSIAERCAEAIQVIEERR